jgi:hypothetical protein
MKGENNELRKTLLRNQNVINDLNYKLEKCESKIGYRNIAIFLLGVYSALISFNLWFTL